MGEFLMLSIQINSTNVSVKNQFNEKAFSPHCLCYSDYCLQFR